MRIHVTVRGKATTVSVDEVLMDYLGAWRVEDAPKYHQDAKFQLEDSTAFIRRIVADLDPPEAGLSAFVQHKILEFVMPDLLTEIIKKRGPKYKKKFGLSAKGPRDHAKAEAAIAVLQGIRNRAR